LFEERLQEDGVVVLRVLHPKINLGNLLRKPPRPKPINRYAKAIPRLGRLIHTFDLNVHDAGPSLPHDFTEETELNKHGKNNRPRVQARLFREVRRPDRLARL